MTSSEQQVPQDNQVVWQALSDAAALAIEGSIRELVTHTGSLTRRLRDLCGGRFSLQLLGERNRRDAPGRVREVLMRCGDSPWVFAQTVIPQATLADHPWLSELGDRPLGDSLFERPNVVRDGLYLACLTPGHPLYERAVRDAGLPDAPDALWARRSVIRIHESGLSINEVFFPAAGQCQPA